MTRKPDGNNQTRPMDDETVQPAPHPPIPNQAQPAAIPQADVGIQPSGDVPAEAGQAVDPHAPADPNVPVGGVQPGAARGVIAR